MVRLLLRSRKSVRLLLWLRWWKVRSRKLNCVSVRHLMHRRNRLLLRLLLLLRWLPILRNVALAIGLLCWQSRRWTKAWSLTALRRPSLTIWQWSEWRCHFLPPVKVDLLAQQSLRHL